MNEQAVAIREDQQIARPEDFLPLLTIEQAINRKQQINQFISKVMVEDLDYGKMPGGRETKILLKPGAEKLCSIFGMAPTYNSDNTIEDWTGEFHGGEALFHYSYRCQLSRGGKFMGEAIGSCNSWETKYRYRWVPEEVAVQHGDLERMVKRGGTKTMFEPNFAVDKAETTGKYGKPAEYWQKWRDAIDSQTAKPGKKLMGGKEYAGHFLSVDETQYRIPNPDIADTINTCQKMAQKRALVAAVLVVTNCSDAFTQDMEDFGDLPMAPPPTQEPPPQSHPMVIEAQAEQAPPQPTQRPRPQPTTIHSPQMTEQSVIQFTGETWMKKFLAAKRPEVFKQILGNYGYQQIDQIPDLPTANKIWITVRDEYQALVAKK